jgi:hypothetical protein
MLCTTIRNGSECNFMNKTGCSFVGGVCRNIIESCKGCARSVELASGWYCSACPDPNTKWKNGECNLATHIVRAPAAAAPKLNPLKASKRGVK